MNPRAQAALEIAAGAAVLGILGDALLRVGPWGINIGLWMLAALLVVLAIARHRPDSLIGGGAWLLVPAVIFSAGFVWRASPLLAMLNLVALAVTASLALWRAQGGRVLASGLAQYALGAILAGLNAAFGALFLIFKDIPWKDLGGRKWTDRSVSMARGVLLAIPLLVVFGALFASADAVFKKLAEDVFHFDFQTLVSHGLLIAFFAWASAGWLRGAALGEERKLVVRETPQKTFSLGIIETGIVLGLLDLLFLAFVGIQVRYLFGGAMHVQVTTGLTYAEYARRGFFELVAVATLALPLLLAAHWLLRKENPAAERAFRVIAGLLVLLLFVVMASAVRRMRLYQFEYGQTEQRVYTTAFMAWLTVVLVWFWLTVLRGRRQRFAAGALIAGYALVVALEVVNPDAYITRTNLERALESRTFDAAYVSSLSADAVPDMVAALPKLTAENSCVISKRLLSRWPASRQSDWRTWNRSRAEAERVIDANRSTLMQYSCPEKEP
jgi:Domain of unknown function (DUF4153)